MTVRDDPAHAAPRDPVEGLDKIGRIIRQRRAIRGMSLQQVADLSGISVGQLSGVERGLYPARLETLRRICAALKMPPRWLFAAGGDGDDHVVVRARKRRRLSLEANRVEKEMLTPDAAANLQMLRMTIEPEGGWTGDFSAPGRAISARCGLVMKGRLELRLDDESFQLAPGDSFGADSRQQIAVRCVGDTRCEVIWVTTPAVY